MASSGVATDAKFGTWEFDILAHDYLPKPLQGVALELAKKTGLCEMLGLEESRLAEFLENVEARYDSSNPYHNAKHAADVLAGVMYLAPRSQKTLAQKLLPHELLALFLAAVGHDAAHFGRNNAFLAATEHWISTRFPTSSLENFHLEQLKLAMDAPEKASADGVGGAAGAVREGGAGDGAEGSSRGDLIKACTSLSDEQRAEVRELVDELVLATDMAQHGRYMKLLGELLQQGEDARSPAEVRRITLVFIIKMADLGNVFRPLDIADEWGERILLEFRNQSKLEKELIAQGTLEKAVINPAPNLATHQLGFLKAVVRPMLDAVAEFNLDDETTRELKRYADKNAEAWSSQIES